MSKPPTILQQITDNLTKTYGKVDPCESPAKAQPFAGSGSTYVQVLTIPYSATQDTVDYRVTLPVNVRTLYYPPFGNRPTVAFSFSPCGIGLSNLNATLGSSALIQLEPSLTRSFRTEFNDFYVSIKADGIGGNLVLLAIDGILDVQAVSSSIIPASVTVSGPVKIEDTTGQAITSSNDAPVGIETSVIARTINRKRGTLLTNTPLLANGTFNSPWFDTELTGTQYVEAIATSNVSSKPTNGFAIFESDDQVTLRVVSFTGAALTNRCYGIIRQRYFQIQFNNSTSNQSSFSLYMTESTIPITTDYSDATTSTQEVQSVVTGGGAAFVLGDGVVNNSGSFFLNASGGGGTQRVATYLFNGSTWDRPRTPSIFKQNSTSASGSTAIWTPASGKKFRLMRFKIQVTDSATIAVAGLLTIALLDSATDLGLSHILAVPTTGGGANAIQDYDSGWIDLGNGKLSSAANNPLNVNLSVALTAGVVNVIVCGTEE